MVTWTKSQSPDSGNGLATPTSPTMRNSWAQPGRFENLLSRSVAGGLPRGCRRRSAGPGEGCSPGIYRARPPSSVP